MLVIAVSGRILAQAARREGKVARVIDRFGDLDTRAAARDLRVAPGSGARVDGEALPGVLDRFSPVSRGESVVWGGGLEGYPELLDGLAEHRELLGNSAEQVRMVKDPAAWSSLLARLGLPHPPIRQVPPDSEAGWLSKADGASGGWHIVPADHNRGQSGRYFQRRAPGTPYSALFVADGRRARILGISEQWTASAQSGDPDDFRYGGVLGHASLGPGLTRELRQAVEALTEATGLRGLNGLDFLSDGRGLQLLEVNPRPVASLDLYREGLRPGPFHLHLSGSRGSLPRMEAEPAGAYRGHAVVYAEGPLRVPQGLLDHPWCADRPRAGTFCPSGAPVCTVEARHGDREETRRMLWRRHRWVRKRLREAGAPETAYSA